MALALLDPGEEMVIAGRFGDYAGKYVVRCQMLDHEDTPRRSHSVLVAALGSR